MKNEVEPYLKVHCREGYIPGAEDIYHGKNGITGKIHVKRYLSENPVGVAVISHGFTEGAPKYEELIYYFLQAGYHVYMPEHMGHGQSYRLAADPSLVHIDIWKRYVRDFLKVCHEIKRAYPELPLNLFSHSMGGAIGAIAAAWFGRCRFRRKVSGLRHRTLPFPKSILHGRSVRSTARARLQ